MSKWTGKSKGTVVGYKIFLFFIQFFGIRATYLLLRVVSFYYYLFASSQRKVLENFYLEGLRIPAHKVKALCRKNFYIFGQTLVDRFIFLIKKESPFKQTFDGEQYLLQMKDAGKGGVLLSAHLGNWETAGNLLRKRISSKINVVMYDGEVEKIKTLLKNNTGGSLFNMIAIKDDLSHVIKIKNALDNGEFVAIHADRYLPDTKTVEIEFLGKKCKFPLGPFIIASKFKAPVTFVYAIKASNFEYALSATAPYTEAASPEAIAEMYVKELEAKVKKNPEQWFNYFDFFNHDN